MADQFIDAYATAFYGVASAQEDVSEVADELFRFARVLEASIGDRRNIVELLTTESRSWSV